jgi:MYXO-CTERM domain-containing protein
MRLSAQRGVWEFLSHDGDGDTASRSTCSCASTGSSWGFFLGVLAFAFWHARRPRLGSFAVAALAVLAIAPLCVRRIWDSEWQALAFPPMFAVLVVALASCAPGPLRRVLEARPLVFLGTVSYRVYMIHYAMWWVLTQALRFAAQVRTVPSGDGSTLLLLESPVAQAAVTAARLPQGRADQLTLAGVRDLGCESASASSAGLQGESLDSHPCRPRSALMRLRDRARDPTAADGNRYSAINCAIRAFRRDVRSGRPSHRPGSRHDPGCVR